MRYKGQNIIEFVIIIVLVAIAGVLVLTMLGNNVNEMFSKSNKKASTYKPFEWENKNSQKPPKIASIKSINGVDVNILEDGSTNFNIEGQNIVISQKVLNEINEVFETAGSDGVNDLIIGSLQELISENKSKYEPDDVPIELLFGNGKRESLAPNYETLAEGNANVNNILAFKVDKDFVIVQKDQSCTGTYCNSSQGIYRISGTIDQNNNITGANVKFQSRVIKSDIGTYNNGSISLDENKNQLTFSGLLHDDFHNFDSKWDIVFDTDTSSKL